MKKLSYSPDYKDKLILLKQDLDIKYGQPVRRKVLSEINHRIQLLKSNPHLGISVRDMTGIDCDFFYIYVEHNFIFYEISDTGIEILNMYHEREEWMIKFLGSRSTFHETSVIYNP